MSDATALESKTVAPDISAVAPSTSSSEAMTAGTSNWTASVVGTTPSYLTVRGWTLAQGRFIDNQDVADHEASVVLGATTASELFSRGDPVGETVNINGVPMTVVGVLDSTGSSSSSTTNQDDEAIIPITTAAERVFGGTSRSSVSSIIVQAGSSSQLSAAYQEADTELLALHHVTTPADADFTITSNASLLSTATSVDKTLTVLLGGIAGISLLVGGIGVMNIMLVSVTERTREIGIRKAIGATKKNILLQFTLEAVTLCMVGGTIGILAGSLFTLILHYAVSYLHASLSMMWVLIAFAVSFTIGLIFGIYPAWKAASMDPIEALRYE